MKLTSWLVLAVAPACLVLAGCGSSGGTVNLAIKVAGGTSRRSLPTHSAPGSRSAQHLSQSFTPTSLKLPIMKISVSKTDGSNEQVLYRCSGATEADCLVDLQSQTALDAITTAARGATITADTYNQVAIYTCADGKSGSDATTAKITGTGTAPGLGGGNWSTSASTLVDTSGGTATETLVGNWSCSTKYVKFPNGITVGSDPLTLTVVVDNYMAAWFGTMVSSGMGGCKVATGSNGLCLTYPALMGYLGTDTATTRRFLIAHDSSGTPASSTKANAIMIVAVNSAGTPLFAYGRQYYTSTSEEQGANVYVADPLANNYDANYSLQYGGPGYVTETVAFSVAADGHTVAIEQGGSADTFSAKFPAFDTSTTATTHGTVTSKDGAHTWSYLSTYLP